MNNNNFRLIDVTAMVNFDPISSHTRPIRKDFRCGLVISETHFPCIVTSVSGNELKPGMSAQLELQIIVDDDKRFSLFGLDQAFTLMAGPNLIATGRLTKVTVVSG